MEPRDAEHEVQTKITYEAAQAFYNTSQIM